MKGWRTNFGYHLQSFRHFCKSHSRQSDVVPKVCLIGGGPSGFYAAQHLIKTLPNVQVDIYERLPVPFGLVRYGVAPDHPEVKNVINTFTKTAHNPRVRFVGNVALGQDVTVQELKQAYHAVCFTYGANKDRTLGIPGEDLGNVVPAREFVGWYNGLPQNRDFSVDLDVETAAIFGQGNVALDVARIMLTPIDVLKKTDITEYALSALARSRIKRVLLIGRRGPLQVAFTIKELREMLNLPGCSTQFDPSDFSGIENVIPNLERPKKRLIELLYKAAIENPIGKKQKETDRIFQTVFLRTPKRFIPREDNQAVVGAAELAINKLEGPDVLSQKAVETELREFQECGLILRSIGYHSVQADPAIPFHSEKGVVQNSAGRVEPGMYAAGWLATGPVGVILSTMGNAFSVGRNMVQDMEQVTTLKPGFEMIGPLLKSRGVQTVSFADWERIDKVEVARGKKLGKPREKIVDIAEMLAIAAGSTIEKQEAQRN
ncbi:NADPH:adrenodoxin oxidoreductase, mitochondrial [Anabrus simplex]|uniref:NADPH:adrenodoxin oxidoreductase, mitochondrial n=1 Tax=Anabrus simplex TaxID=316456 RepID=UPI0035A3ACB3